MKYDYFVVRSFDLDHMSKDVADRLNRGWKLAGPMTCYWPHGPFSFQFFQPMIKEPS